MFIVILSLHDDSLLTCFTWDLVHWAEQGRLPNGGLYNISVENIFVFIVVSTEVYWEQRYKIGRDRKKEQQQNPRASGMEAKWQSHLWWVGYWQYHCFLTTHTYMNTKQYILLSWWKQSYLFNWLIGLFLLFRGCMALVHRWDPCILQLLHTYYVFQLMNLNNWHWNTDKFNQNKVQPCIRVKRKALYIMWLLYIMWVTNTFLWWMVWQPFFCFLF